MDSIFSLAYVRSIVSTIVKVEGESINQSVLTPIYTLVCQNFLLCCSISLNTQNLKLFSLQWGGCNGGKLRF